MVNTNRKEYRITARLNDKDYQLLKQMSNKYNIDSSECIRRGIHALESGNQTRNQFLVPMLCELCNLCNEIVERAEINDADKSRLTSEVSAIWKQL